jgi:Na+/glutamate symporter
VHLILLTVMLVDFVVVPVCVYVCIFVLMSQMHPTWWSVVVFVHSMGFGGVVRVST